MADFVGMDPDAVDASARLLRAKASQLASLETSTGSLVSQLGAQWNGPDAQRFRGGWDQQHRPAIRRLHDAIEELAQSAQRNASEQRAASAAGTGNIAGSGSAGGGHGVDWFDRITGSGPHGLFDLGSGISDVIEHKDLFDRLSKTGLTDKTINSIMKSPQGGSWLGRLGTAWSVFDVGSAVANHDSAGTKTATLGLISSRLPWPLNLAAGGAMLYGQTVLPTTDQEISNSYDYSVKAIFGSGVDSSSLSPSQAAYMTHRYEGPMGVINAVSDGMDYKLRWLHI